MKPTLRALPLLALLAAAPATTQKADADWEPRVKHPAYASEGPIVAIDEGHRNFHTLGGGYAPFAALLRADGYRVRAAFGPLTADSLRDLDVLVIANARGTPPPQPAFTEAEVTAVRQWVEGGGSLLLIADHAPFGRAAAGLAAAFGVAMGQGYAVARQRGEVDSQIAYSGALLGRHPILAGRDRDEAVRAVTSFTGQSLGVPDGATALLILPPDAIEVAGRDDIRDLRRGLGALGRKVGGRAQAVALAAGKGRVVVAGEAAMFTVQKVEAANRGSERVGLNVDDDDRFALGVLHWLSHLTGV